MIVTAASTASSMAEMIQAARMAVRGEGLVIPIVLMKAFEMNSISFMASS